jgi:phenylalanyl-tRNA synthetase beta chain
MLTKEQGETELANDASEEIIYRIEIAANRYDLLCLEGLVAALLVFLEKREQPTFELVEPVSGEPQQLIVTENPATIRPFVVGAVLRNVTFTKEIYNSFIDLQVSFLIFF